MNKIKKFLREIFAPKATYYINSKRVSKKEWEKVGRDFDKISAEMDQVFKEAESIFRIFRKL